MEDVHHLHIYKTTTAESHMFDRKLVCLQPACLKWMLDLVCSTVLTLPALLRRYGFEALVYNEYHGATGFFFTPYAQKRIPGAKLPSVEVDGDTILGTFGFETENIANDVAVLVALLCAYLTITLLLLIFKRH